MNMMRSLATLCPTDRVRIAVLLLVGTAPLRAATVWDGSMISFIRPNGADPTQAANQDRLTPHVWLTRDSTRGLYNARVEGSYVRGFSPGDTEWATGTTAVYDTLTYAAWEDWARTLGGPPSMIGVDAVVHLITEDIYLDLRFTSWTMRGGGGFAYERSTEPSENQPPTVSITNPGDGTVYSTPTEVTIEATADDPDGSVVQVEFFDGSASLGVDDSAPYTLTTTLDAGDHVLTAVALDLQGAMATSAAVLVTVESVGQEIANPIAEVIPKGDIVIELEPVASGMVAPLGMAVPDDNSGRVFVYDQAGLIYVLQDGERLANPLLDLTDRLVTLGIQGPGSFDERGLLGLALHPDFASNPLLYTYSSEPVEGPADFTVPLPEGEVFNHQSVVAEWRIDPANIHQVDPTSRRELLRIDQPQFNHNAGVMHFGPDGMLYVVVGDGGAADDQGLGHVEGGNGQSIDNIYGAVIRIDPAGTHSANGQYGLPASNPFVGQPGLDEIFAYGFRNPFSFGFDPLTGELFLGDVGQNDIEEINIVLKGGNYGWNIKEGSFFFDPNGEDDGFLRTQPVREVPPGLIDPIAEYDHDDGLAIIGGFVYRGNSVPRLAGRYITGDYQAPGTSHGRLFYLDAGELKEFQIGQDDRTLNLLLKGLGQDAQGEVYVFGSQQVGPFGTEGQMLKVVSPGPPVTLTKISASAAEVTLDYEGGVGPFTILRAGSIDDPVWSQTSTTPDRTWTVPLLGDQGFYRVADEALVPAIPMTLWLTGEAARPEPIATTGGGFGSALLQGDQLVFNIAYSDLPEAATAAHFHGPADIDQTAGVLIDLAPYHDGEWNTAGGFAGTVALTPHQLSTLKRGHMYVNIHTPSHPSGEIRGQLVPVVYTASLSGKHQQPHAVDSPGFGSGIFTLVRDRLTFNTTYSGLPEAAVAAHIHAPGTQHQTAPVSIDLEPYNGSGFGSQGTLSGSLRLSPGQFLDVAGRRAYVNLHTPSNAGGEIRGQLLPENLATPFSAILTGESQRPDPVNTEAAGTASILLRNDQLQFELEYRNLSGAATGAHIHGPADIEGSAGILLDLEPYNGQGFGPQGTLSGTVKLTPVQKAYLLEERTYFNIHTVAHPAGEIRGQLVKLLRKTTLSGQNQRPDPALTDGDGFGLWTLVRDRLAFDITYSDLTGPATAAHIHGPASFDESAGVLIGLEPFKGPGFGISGLFSGEVQLTSEQRRFLIDQRAYLNVHTEQYPPGEIRGQITP